MQAVNHMPEVDFELDTFTVVVLKAGDRAAKIEEVEASRLLSAHLAYTIGLTNAGNLLGAGSLEDSSDE